MVNSSLKQALVYVLLSIVKLVRHFSRKTNVVVICPPFPSDSNIGDRAQCIGALNALRGLTDAPIRMIQASKESVPPFSEHANVLIDSQFYKLFLFEGDLESQLKWIMFLRNAQVVFMIGADSFDESYSVSQSHGKLAAIALSGRLGIPTRVISFSINQLSSGGIRRMNSLPESVYLYARDPISFKRLNSADVKNALLTADLSFLVSPSESISDQRVANFLVADERRIVGINFTYPMFSRGVSIEDRLRYLSDAFYELATVENVRFLLLPNSRDQRDAFFASFHAMLEARQSGISCLVDPIPPPEELKRIIHSCYYMFSVSLHMSLFALSVCVPVTCFPYFGKFEGIFGECGIADSKILLESLPETSSELAGQLREHFQMCQLRRDSLRSNLHRIKETSRDNFRNVPGSGASRWQ